MSSKNDPYRLVKYVARGALEGVLAGWVTLLIMKYLDIAGLQHLIHDHPDGPLAFVMLLIFFGMIGIAWRVMVLLPDEKD